MSDPNSKTMLVEDTDIQGVVIGLMKRYVNWSETKEKWPVYVRVLGGKDEVLKLNGISAELKASGIRAVGVVIDADTSASNTWARIAQICNRLGGTPPPSCPTTGFIMDVGSKKFGAWIMPDNKSNGTVENFCHSLVPDPNDELWCYARSCKDEAKNRGADYTHSEKAHIHTWLAWRNPPGERMGRAITKGLLRHDVDIARNFAQWFTKLYEVAPH